MVKGKLKSEAPRPLALSGLFGPKVTTTNMLARRGPGRPPKPIPIASTLAEPPTDLMLETIELAYRTAKKNKMAVGDAARLIYSAVRDVARIPNAPQRKKVP